MDTASDFSSITLAYAVPLEPIALYTACKARLCQQPLIDFFKLIHLRRQRGTLDSSTLHLGQSPPTVSLLPPEIIRPIQDQIFIQAESEARLRLHKEVGQCACINEGGGVCGVDRPVSSCWDVRYPEGCYDLVEVGLLSLIPEISKEPVASVLKMYRLRMCYTSHLNVTNSIPMLSPALVGLPLLPRSASTHPPPSWVSAIIADEMDASHVRCFSLGSSIPPLTAGQKLRFEHFLSDLDLGKHLLNKDVAPVSLVDDGKVELQRKDATEGEDGRGEPELIFVHGAMFMPGDLD